MVEIPDTPVSLLHRISSIVSSNRSVEEMLGEIIGLTAQVTECDACLVYLIDHDTREIVLRASQVPHAMALGALRMQMGEGITGWVARQKQQVAIARGANKDSRFKYFRNLPEDKFEAFLSVPIMTKRGVVGVINIQHKKPHDHSAMEINLLTAIGKLVGGAVENARLIEETFSLKEALELRKLVEKAKGILMKRKHVSEDEAYRTLQKESMDRRKTLKEIADAIILAEQLDVTH